MSAKRGNCKVRRCARRAAPRKGRKCHTCHSRIWRANHPMRAAFHNLKAGAKVRGKAFDLSFADFEKFCLRLDYLKKCGTAADAFHIDRKDETKGYTLDNIQMITNRENTKKYVEFRRNLVRDQHGHEWQKCYPKK